MRENHFPEPLRRDIEQAARVLKQFGAQRVFIFGSALTATDPSQIGDIDIAVAGLPPGNFFQAYGKLIMSLNHPFDLVDLDNCSAFVQTLKEYGKLKRVA